MLKSAQLQAPGIRFTVTAKARASFHESENAQAVSVEVKTRCPAVLISTNNRGIADYYLRISPESSIMYRRSGEIAYTFSAKFDASNLAKGICAFARQKAPVEMDSPMDPQ
jgi:hypothetical protein